MPTKREFLDTNVFIYLIDAQDNLKYQRANELYIRSNLVTSAQVLTEIANVCLKKLKKPKREIAQLIDLIRSEIEVVPITSTDFGIAHELVNKHDFSYFDALVIATALSANCQTLYSEDLQNGRVIDKKLTIINPFI
jgi:predicted nucleic acid-binding protein